MLESDPSAAAGDGATGQSHAGSARCVPCCIVQKAVNSPLRRQDSLALQVGPLLPEDTESTQSSESSNGLSRYCAIRSSIALTTSSICLMFARDTSPGGTRTPKTTMYSSY